MINETASVVIACLVDEVYSFMSDPRNRLRYDPGLIAVRVTPDGPLRIGTQIAETRSLLGVKREMVTEVTDLEPNQVIGYRTLPGDPVNASGSYRFAVVPEGTRLTLNFTLDPQGWMRLIVPFMAGGLRRDIQAGLSNVKAVLEQPPGAQV